MDFFMISRRMARLQYATARLPLTVLDEYVVPRYLNAPAFFPVRLGFRLVLGTADGFTGWLLGDEGMSRRGQEDRQAALAAARQAVTHEHERIKTGAGQQPPDPADKRRLVKYRPEDAGHAGQPAASRAPGNGGTASGVSEPARVN
jgi:hypothetical protein